VGQTFSRSTTFSFESKAKLFENFKFVFFFNKKTNFKKFLKVATAAAP